MLYLVIGIEREAHALFALCIECDELMRHILYCAFYVASGLLPLTRAELVELYAAVISGTDVLRHHIQLSYGDIELVGACVLYGDIVLGNAVHFQLSYTDEPADTVTRMYNEVTLGDVCK